MACGCGCQECAAHDAAVQARFTQKGRSKMDVLLECFDMEVYDVSSVGREFL